MPIWAPQTSGMNQVATFDPKNHYGNKGNNQKISILENSKIVISWSLKKYLFFEYDDDGVDFLL